MLTQIQTDPITETEVVGVRTERCCTSIEPVLFLLTFLGGAVSLYALKYFLNS